VTFIVNLVFFVARNSVFFVARPASWRLADVTVAGHFVVAASVAG
jgi:hypothetical protein